MHPEIQYALARQRMREFETEANQHRLARIAREGRSNRNAAALAAPVAGSVRRAGDVFLSLASRFTRRSARPIG